MRYYITSLCDRAEPYNVCLHSRFIRYRNLLQFLIKRAKFSFHKRRIEDMKGDPKQFWSVVNEVAGRPAAKEPFPVQAFALQGEPVTLNFIKDISQSFNSYLSSVGLQLTEALTPSGPTEVEDAKYATVAVFE